MRWLRRTKEANILTDYSQVADAVHLRHAARDSEASREVSVESLREVRSYRPTERLEEVAEQTRGFVEDSKQTPRTFGEDWMPPPARKPVGILTLAGIAMGVNILAASILA